MWEKTYTRFYPNITAEEIWSTLIDIKNWPKWHNDLEYCKLSGDFKKDNYFKLKPKGVRPVKVYLKEVIENIGFTDCTSFPGAKMYNKHYIEKKDNGVILKNTVQVTGVLKCIWIKLVAKNVADTMPDEMDSLYNYIKTKEKH